jgi:sterol desaturase/sphingolipid hydroxylase (fatty acid hydroxylase superfamily)
MGRFAQEMDSEDRRFGSGYISGMLSIVLGAVGLGTVLCLMYPQLLTVPEIHTLYSDQVVGLIRLALHVVLITAFVFGILSITLRQSKSLGFAGIAIVLVAAVMGGSRASRHMTGETDMYFGLDFFLLNLILLGTIFIPIERLFRRNEQPIFRDDWREDLFYFFVSSLFVQALTYMSLTPSLQLVQGTDWATGFREMVASQPLILQFFEIMFVTDFVQYWFHRLFHEIPWLWKFHAVHHSAQKMDWIAGSRMHVCEIVLLRAFTTVPMYFMGYSESALYAYIFFVYLFSVFVHSNVRFHFKFMQHILCTPRFHHWHHGVEKESININYAVHFPILDRIFGTYHMPGEEWPVGYGIKGHPVPRGYFAQFKYPFQKQAKTEPAEPDGNS